MSNVSSFGRKKPRIRRDWVLANLKVEDEGDLCRNCGAYGTERAHIIGREHDAVPPVRPALNWFPYQVAPDRIIPLCNACHQGPNGVHAKRLDLLPLLTLNEQIQAVADAGGISRAYDFLMPSESPRKLGRAA